MIRDADHLGRHVVPFLGVGRLQIPLEAEPSRDKERPFERAEGNAKPHELDPLVGVVLPDFTLSARLLVHVDNDDDAVVLVIVGLGSRQRVANVPYGAATDRLAVNLVVRVNVQNMGKQILVFFVFK